MVKNSSPKGKELIVSPSEIRGSVYVGKKKMKRSPGSVIKRRKELQQVVKVEKFNIKCNPTRLCELVSSLNNAQKECIRNVGFGGLLHVTDWHYVSWFHSMWFFENFNPLSRVLSFKGGHNLVLKSSDIEDMFLLPRPKSGSLNVVCYGRSDEDGTDVMKSFKTKFGFGLVGTPTVKAVFDLLTDRSNDRFENGGDDFVVLFILYALSTFLTPVANTCVDLSVLKSLFDVGSISKFDWCTYVLEKLCKALDSFRRNDYSVINGCVLVIPLLYFHQFKWQGVAEPRTLPLIKHWSSAKFNKRIKSESRSKSEFGTGEWVVGLFPISDQVVVEENEGGDRRSGHTENKERGAVPSEKKEDADECAASSSHYIKYRIPLGEKTDEDIKSVNENELHRSFMMLQRDLNVVVSSHKDRVESFRRNCSKHGNDFGSASSFQFRTTVDNDPFWTDEVLKILDDLVARYQSSKNLNAKTSEEEVTKDEVLKNAEKEHIHGTVDDHFHNDEEQQKSKKKKKSSMPSFNIMKSIDGVSSSSESESEFAPVIVVQSLATTTGNEDSVVRDKSEEVQNSVNQEDEDKKKSVDVINNVDEHVSAEEDFVIQVTQRASPHYKLDKTDEVVINCSIDPMMCITCAIDWPSEKDVYSSRSLSETMSDISGSSPSKS